MRARLETSEDDARSLAGDAPCLRTKAPDRTKTGKNEVRGMKKCDIHL